MFEPELPHNRAEFDRLGRLKLWGLPVTVVVGMAFVLSVYVLFPDISDERMAVIGTGPLAAYGIFLGYLEFKRAIIFRRDLRERRPGQ